MEQEFFPELINSILFELEASNIFIGGYLYNICLKMMIKKLKAIEKKIDAAYANPNPFWTWKKEIPSLHDAAILSFINWFVEAAGKTDAKNKGNIDLIKLCFNFLTLKEMLSYIKNIGGAVIMKFVDDKFKYLDSEEFINDVQASKNHDVINKTKDEMKKMGMDLQANYVSRSKFSFLGSLHPQRHTMNVIEDVADMRYVMQL